MQRQHNIEFEDERPRFCRIDPLFSCRPCRNLAACSRRRALGNPFITGDCIRTLRALGPNILMAWIALGSGNELIQLRIVPKARKNSGIARNPVQRTL